MPPGFMYERSVGESPRRGAASTAVRADRGHSARQREPQGRSRDPRGEAVAERLEAVTCGSAPSPGSLPITLGVPSERAGELGIALATADGALDEIDAASQIGERGGACDGVVGGQDGGQRQCQVQGFEVVAVARTWQERSRAETVLANWARDPHPSEFDHEIGREIVRIEQAIRAKDDRVLKEYGDLQACLKRIVELKDLHRSSSPGTMIHGFATWRSRRLPGGGF